MQRSTLSEYAAVVITGGSSGIGEAFIKRIGTLDRFLPICNLSRTPAAEIRAERGDLHVKCDIGDPVAVRAAVRAVTDWVARLPRPGKLLLINNSGFGCYGNFASGRLAQELELIRVNIGGLVQLTGELLPLLESRGGSILNVASTAGWQPTPYLATYGASKAFVRNWSLAIDRELRPRGVPVTVLCPGPTESQFFARAGFSAPPAGGYGHTAEAVVDCALRGWARGRPVVVPGVLNKLMVVVGRRLPIVWQAALAEIVLRRMRMRGVAA
jgi:uncharacterized protein